jgi:hypothetical protein
VSPTMTTTIDPARTRPALLGGESPFGTALMCPEGIAAIQGLGVPVDVGNVNVVTRSVPLHPYRLVARNGFTPAPSDTLTREAGQVRRIDVVVATIDGRRGAELKPNRTGGWTSASAPSAAPPHVASTPVSRWRSVAP